MPGAVLPVLVDPADPKDVMIDDAPQPGLAGSGAGGSGAVVLGPAGAVAPFAGWAGFGPGSDPAAAGMLSPDLMATISEALRQASDQFATGQFSTGSTGSTSITVNGQTFQVPGGGGQTIVISPSGEVLTGAAAAAAGGAIAAGAAGLAGAGPSAPSAASTHGPPAAIPPVAPAAPAADAGTPASAIPSAIPSAPTATAGTSNGRISIDSLTDTGTQLGDMRLYSFELTVSPAGGMPYKLSHAALVPSAQVPRLIQGASFPAIIDANLPGGIGIFWDR
jgi:hypothetical protein